MDGWKETQQSNSVLQKVTCRCLNYIRNVGNADILVQTKAKSVAKVIEDLPLGNMNVCTHFHPNQIESYGHISVWEWCTNLQTSTSTATMQTNWTWMSVVWWISCPKIRLGWPKLGTQQENMRIVMSGWSVRHLQGGNIVVACFATGRQRLHTFPSPMGGDCMSKLAPVEMLQFKCLAVRAAWGSWDRHAPAATKPYWGKEKKKSNQGSRTGWAHYSVSENRDILWQL